jgi:hypothetical protein
VTNLHLQGFLPVQFETITHALVNDSVEHDLHVRGVRRHEQRVVRVEKISDRKKRRFRLERDFAKDVVQHDRLYCNEQVG